MGRNDLHNMRVVEQWERSLNIPPEDRAYPQCSCCGDPIADGAYVIEGDLLCEDCAKEECRVYFDEGESIDCEGCGEPILDEDYFYSVGGDAYCSECFKKFFEE